MYMRSGMTGAYTLFGIKGSPFTIAETIFYFEGSDTEVLIIQITGDSYHK
jgi:hypothetical protein